jgi:oligopeptide/dipeptide ABC transporter ATP-binding protein
MIEAIAIEKRFPGRGGILGREPVHALRGVDLSVKDGGAVAIIGESGCGKTTLGRIICGLESYDGGELVIDGDRLSSLAKNEAEKRFRRIQIIHQDPYSALNPTRTISQILSDPLELRAAQTNRDRSWVRSRAGELLDLVGLDPSYCLPRYPHMLSGGMRQRVVVARALTVDPSALVADEAVSMIDVSLRLGILSLLRRLRAESGVSLIFITHDVAAARYIGEGCQLMVLYRGAVIEQGPIDAVIERPLHPYTQCLLSAIPVLRGVERPGSERLIPLEGLDDTRAPAGCLFSDRCPFAEPDCRAMRPQPVSAGTPGHFHACLYPKQRDVLARPEVVGGAGDSPFDRAGQYSI